MVKNRLYGSMLHRLLSPRYRNRVVLPLTWLPPSTPSEEGVVPHTRRDLSDEEKKELEKHSRKIWKSPLLSALIFDCWIGVPLTVHLLTHTPLTVEPMAYFMGGMAMWSTWSLIGALRMSRRLLRDREEGTVAVIHLAAPPRDEATALDETPAQNLLLEFLPVSQAQWTVNGQPAPWRKIPSLEGG